MGGSGDTVDEDGNNVWNARVLVDLTGATAILSPSQLVFYLEELRVQMEEAFNLRCPESGIEVDPIVFAGQVFTSASSSAPAPLFRGRRKLQADGLQGDGTTQVDQYVSARYRKPPRQPNFSALSLYAIDSVGSVARPSTFRRRRELSRSPYLDDAESKSMLYQGHPDYIGDYFEDPGFEVDWADEHSPFETYNETGDNNTHHQQELGVSYRNDYNIKRNQHIDGIGGGGASSVPGAGVDRTEPEEERICQPTDDFLTRLRAMKDLYFMQVEQVSALVLEGSFSFSLSFDFGFDAEGLLERTSSSSRNNQKLWWRY
jgi:hypothetical protein